MQRSRLRNIIDKSKGISNKSVGDPFDDFVKSLPKELDYYKNDDNYRLKAAWVAYGTPKNYKEAVWEGLIQPIDENTYKMPSIGYNNETEDYEYLNKGKDGEIVEKDIRAWDNDVIPFIKELKQGGYVRTFNEEENFWTYSKNSQKKEEPIESGEQQTVIEFLQGGNKIKKGKSYSEWVKTVNPEFVNDDYDLERAYNELPIEELEAWRLNTLKPENERDKSIHLRDDGSTNGYKKPNHMTYSYPGYGWSGSDEKGWTFTISPEQYLMHGGNEGAWDKYVKYWNKNEPNATLQTWNGVLKYKVPHFEEGLQKMKEYDFSPIYHQPNSVYVEKPKALKQGGQMTVIPEGALHARKNNMELAKEGEITHKGIPVIDNNGEQQAEIEKEEIIFSKKVTDKMEELYKKYKSDESSSEIKDKVAIEMGKIITCELMKNTDDRTGLIQEVANNM